MKECGLLATDTTTKIRCCFRRETDWKKNIFCTPTMLAMRVVSSAGCHTTLVPRHTSPALFLCAQISTSLNFDGQNDQQQMSCQCNFMSTSVPFNYRPTYKSNSTVTVCGSATVTSVDSCNGREAGSSRRRRQASPMMASDTACMPVTVTVSTVVSQLVMFFPGLAV